MADLFREKSEFLTVDNFAFDVDRMHIVLDYTQTLSKDMLAPCFIQGNSKDYSRLIAVTP